MSTELSAFLFTGSGDLNPSITATPYGCADGSGYVFLRFWSQADPLDNEGCCNEWRQYFIPTGLCRFKNRVLETHSVLQQPNLRRLVPKIPFLAGVTDGFERSDFLTLASRHREVVTAAVEDL